MKYWRWYLVFEHSTACWGKLQIET